MNIPGVQKQLDYQPQQYVELPQQQRQYARLQRREQIRFDMYRTVDDDGREVIE